MVEEKLCIQSQNVRNRGVTVIFRNFKSSDLKLRVSNPRFQNVESHCKANPASLLGNAFLCSSLQGLEENEKRYHGETSYKRRPKPAETLQAWKMPTEAVAMVNVHDFNSLNFKLRVSNSDPKT